MIYLQRFYIRFLMFLLNILFLIEALFNVFFSFLEIFIINYRNKNDLRIILVNFRNEFYLKLIDWMTLINTKQCKYENNRRT